MFNLNYFEKEAVDRSDIKRMKQAMDYQKKNGVDKTR